MTNRYPLYDGDGIIHSQSETGAVASHGDASAAPGIVGADALSGPLNFSEIERIARRSRSRTLAALISGFMDWIDAGIQRAKYRDLERYLAKSTDLADLEHRMRRIESEPRNMLPVG